MRTLALSLALMCAARSATAQQEEQQEQKEQEAYRFVLDYDVPESPAFTVLGVTPGQVVRGSAAKPVVATILNQLLAGERLASGVALDFAPYFLFGGRLQSIQEYWDSRLKRALAHATLSAATVQAESDTASLQFGVGVRVVLLDQHDLLQEPLLAQRLDAALAAAARAPDRPVADEITRVDLARRGADLKAIYDEVRDTVRARRGHALALGWGLAGLLRGSVFAMDSVDASRQRLWLAHRYAFGRGLELLSTTQLRFGAAEETALLAGVALRASSSAVNFAGEVAYDSRSGELLPGGNAEVRVLPGVHFVAALVVAAPEGGLGERRLRMRTNVRWNMSE